MIKRWVGVGLAALASAACSKGEIVPTEVVIVDHDADGNEVLTRLVRLKEADASADPHVVTEPRIDVDPAADYADVAKLMALIQTHGLEKVGVIGGQ